MKGNCIKNTAYDRSSVGEQVKCHLVYHPISVFPYGLHPARQLYPHGLIIISLLIIWSDDHLG